MANDRKEVRGLGFYSENGIRFQAENKHIMENIKRVLTTRRGERVGNLSFGSDVSKFIFLPEMNIDDLIKEIVRAINTCEPRVNIIECTLKAFENDKVTINLTVQVKSTKEIINTDINL